MEREVLTDRGGYTGDYADTMPAAVKRISWGAVFAGIVVTMALHLMLGVLGLAIGANSINPMEDQNPVDGLANGTLIWFGISTLVALFAGGWVAGRLAGMPQRTDSLLHGLLTWGLTTVVTFYLVTTTIGGLISGAAGVLGKGMSLLGQGVSAAAPAVGDAIGTELDRRGIDVSAIQREAEILLRQTGKPELQPDSIGAAGEAAVNSAERAAEQSARNPQAADTELSSVLSRIATSGDRVLQAADREALTNILVARGMTQQEANTTVARWDTTYQQAAVRYDQFKVDAEMQARETGAGAADAVAEAALWTFVMLLLGAGAALFGGMLGAPRDLMDVTEHRTVQV